jgi:predicted nucleic acid-binding protein
MTTFLDTNVLIYLLDPGAEFHTWSVQELQSCKASGPAVISDIVYCEFSFGMATQNDVDAVVSQFGLERLRADDAALFRAGQAFAQYKSRCGNKTNVLPDFLIGALAEVAGAPLVTANHKDFVGYFPNLKVISPP